MPYRLIAAIDGKRGGLLVVAGVGYVLIGLVYVLTGTPRSVDLAFAWTTQPAHVLGWQWVILGLVAIGTSFRPKLERWGFAALIVAPGLWTAVFAGSAFFGNPFGLRGGVAYAVWTAVILYVADWPNPVSVRVVKPADPLAPEEPADAVA